MIFLSDEEYMREALKEAMAAAAVGEVPIGAVLVLNGEIIARARNEIEASPTASSPAEMFACELGSVRLANWRLLGATLYSTLEPCPMCAGAMLQFRIARLVYGAPDLRFGAAGSLFDLFALPHPTHSLEVKGGVLAEPAAELMRDFFRSRRKEPRRRE